MSNEIYDKLKNKLDEKGYIQIYILEKKTGQEKIKKIIEEKNKSQAKQKLIELTEKHEKINNQEIFQVEFKLFKPNKTKDPLVNGVLGISISNHKNKNGKITKIVPSFFKIFWMPEDQYKNFRTDNVKLMIQNLIDKKIDMNPLKIITINDIIKQNISYSGIRILKKLI